MSNLIQIIDTDFNSKGQIDAFDSWIQQLKHGKGSSCLIQMSNDANNADQVLKQNIVYNSDNLEYPCVVTELPRNFDAEQNVKTVVGYDVFWLFEGRLANENAADLVYTNKKVEYIVKDLISTNILNSDDRELDFLTVLSGDDKGSTITATIRYGANLKDTIIELLAVDNLGLNGCVNTSSGKIEIDLYEGTDRSDTVKFNLDFNNLISGEEIDGITLVKNYVYVGGSDNGTRVTEEVGTATGIDRRELFVDGGETSDSTELQAIGQSAQTTEEKGGTYSVQALVGSFVYGVDFFLGDIVNVAGNDLRVLEAEIIKEEQKPDDVFLTFGQPQIRNTDELDNHETRINNLEIQTGGTRREVLTANRTYYVSTTGSDSNDGLTSGNAFATWQYAFDTVGMLDVSIYNITIQIADGTYTESGLQPKDPISSGGAVTVQGNTSNYDSVVLSHGTSNGFDMRNTKLYTLKYIKFDGGATPVTNNHCIKGDVETIFIANNIHCYNVGRVVNSNNGADITITSNIKISSTANLGILFLCQNGSVLSATSGIYDLSSLTDFAVFSQSATLCRAAFVGSTFDTTSFSGLKYVVATNSVLVISTLTLPGTGVFVTSGGQVL